MAERGPHDVKASAVQAYNDGGREPAGFKGKTDCTCRAIAIAAQLPYEYVYDLLNENAKEERITKHQPKRKDGNLQIDDQACLKRSRQRSCQKRSDRDSQGRCICRRLLGTGTNAKRNG